MNDVQFGFIFGANALVGVGIFLVWKAQGGLLDKYRDLVSAVDPSKLKEVSELMEKGAETKANLRATEHMNTFQKKVMTIRSDTERRWRLEYNELMGYFVSGLIDEEPLKVDQILSDLPLSAATIRGHIERSVLERVLGSSPQTNDTSPKP